jgi:Tol biopolymer transport system component
LTADRWRQVEDLCHVALTRPAAERAAFLAAACAGDADLQREVESLLAGESDADAFMRVPAAALVDSAGVEPPRNQLVGHRFGSYTISALLGIGGMGEVYRAHDDTLGREVAIKVLPLAFTADPERRARFEREARTLATLNHPHIGAIYGVEEADGVRGLVLELVEGETLADRIPTGAGVVGSSVRGLPVAEVLVIARQIADALEAAHEKGIVHRDLKPANIKITPNGVVKVLDFGLAKAATTDSNRPDPSESRDGVILGTAAYMSPEQARGQVVDKRGDIWAFGCVLYEMLTGRLAFPGETISDTIAKILEREPDWSALPAITPAALRRILLLCLAKDPKQRLRDIGDVRIEIEAIDLRVPGLSDPTVVNQASGSRWRWLPWLAVAMLAAGVIAWEARRTAPRSEDPLADARFSRFTDWEGTESHAEISPDGRFVVFVADRAGQFDLWVSQVGTGRFLNLTADIPSLGPGGGILRNFGFAGDGAEIWFSPPEARAQRPTQNASRTESKMLLPLMGGTSRNFLGEGAEAPSWSPDGSRLVYFINGGGDPLFIADGAGADARKLLKDHPQGVHNHNPVWSPDGEWIYFVQGSDPTGKMDVWRVHPTGASLERMTQLNVGPNFLAPLDTRTLLYVARADDRSGPWLWALDLDRKVTRRVLSGLEHYTSVSASHDGRRVVATVTNPTASLWRVPLLDGSVTESDVQPYPVPTVRALAPRFAKTSLFYLSAQGTGDGLWRVQDQQASEVWRGANMALSEPAAISRDGDRVAVVVRREGKRQVTVMSADGTNVRTLAPSIDIQGAAGQSAVDWSPDGAWIVAGGRDASGAALFKIPVEGGEPIRLVEGQVSNPIWSSDGNLIIYAGPLVAGQTALLAVRPDGAPVDLPSVRVRHGAYRFLPDGRHLVFLPVNVSLDFWLLDIAAKTTRQLTHLDDRGDIGTFDITPDGKQIVFDRSRENSDIVLIDLAR